MGYDGKVELRFWETLMRHDLYLHNAWAELRISAFLPVVLGGGYGQR
jgi:hypothetical protein